MWAEQSIDGSDGTCLAQTGGVVTVVVATGVNIVNAF